MPWARVISRRRGRKPGRRHDVTALAEDRLDDDRRHVLRVRQRAEGQVELLLPVAGAGRIGRVRGAGRAVAVRERRAVHGAGERLEIPPIDVLGSRESHRLGGATVVATPKDEDHRAFRGHPGELDGGLHRLGPRVGEEGLPRPARQDGPKSRVQAQSRLVVDDVLLAVQEPGGLRLDGGNHAGMGMTGVRDPDPGAVVEVALTVGRDQPAPLAPVHGEVRHAAPDGGHHGSVGERRGGAAQGCRLDHHGLLRVAAALGDVATRVAGAAAQPVRSRRWRIVPTSRRRPRSCR